MTSFLRLAIPTDEGLKGSNLEITQQGQQVGQRSGALDANIPQSRILIFQMIDKFGFEKLA